MPAKKDRDDKPRASRRRRPPPTLLGGIDVGSTAMRMKIAECPGDAGAPLRVVEELTYPISTGADSFRKGRIQSETLFSICSILDNYRRVLDDYGVTRSRAVASTAVREASNRDILVDRVRHNSGMDLEILDAVEESRLAYRALLPWLRQRQGSYSMALNLGGGSTEIMILRGDDLQTGGAKRIGTSRLFHAAGQGGGQSRFERLQAIAANIVSPTREAYQDYNISHFFLINRMLYRALRSDPCAVPHERDFVVPADAVRELVRRTVSLSPLEIGRIYNMGLSDVEMFIPALLILDQFVDVAEVDEVTFTDTEVLAGLLMEMEMELRGENPLMSFRRQMVRSARDLGEQYNYDRTHARLVTDFSLELFDSLKDMLDLDSRDRLLLELAAVLHDIGMYVAEHHHHRHSAYLVKWSEIVGLSERDRRLVSQIVYFHRVELPSSDHPDYMALSRIDRLRVSKLAGILRLADVFDRGHRQTARSLRTEVVGDKLLIHVSIGGDMGIILDALPKKADLIEQVTGLSTVLRREMPDEGKGAFR